MRSHVLWEEPWFGGQEGGNVAFQGPGVPATSPFRCGGCPQKLPPIPQATPSSSQVYNPRSSRLQRV